MHSLRHSAATALIASGYPIAKVAAILGHSSSRVTEMVYSHLIGKDLEGAADVMERLYGAKRRRRRGEQDGSYLRAIPRGPVS